MKAYNGFSAQHRQRALKWFREEQKQGRRAYPTRCDACGQDQGLIDSHSEDYSAPFGDHIGRFSLCFTCHMMIHCRHRAPLAFEVYRESIERGARYAPFKIRDFPTFSRQFLKKKPIAVLWGEPREDLLGRMASGEFVKSNEVNK